MADPATDFFWTGATEGRLLFQRCEACGELRYPPAIACHVCRSTEYALLESSGRGRLYSYASARRPRMSFLEEGSVFAIVELDEGVRMLSHRVDTPPEEIRFGMPVAVT